MIWNAILICEEKKAPAKFFVWKVNNLPYLSSYIWVRYGSSRPANHLRLNIGLTICLVVSEPWIWAFLVEFVILLTEYEKYLFLSFVLIISPLIHLFEQKLCCKWIANNCRNLFNTWSQNIILKCYPLLSNWRMKFCSNVPKSTVFQVRIFLLVMFETKRRYLFYE